MLAIGEQLPESIVRRDGAAGRIDYRAGIGQRIEQGIAERGRPGRRARAHGQYRQARRRARRHRDGADEQRPEVDGRRAASGDRADQRRTDDDQQGDAAEPRRIAP